MAPPKFGLDAKSKKEEVTGDEKMEAIFRETLESGNYDEASMIRAARHVMRHYGMYDENLVELQIGQSANPRALATTKGEMGPDEVQRISISKEVFYRDFTFAVRTFGHEYQHALYNWNHEGEKNHAETEFLAYAWEVLENTVAEHPNATTIIRAEGWEAPSIPSHRIKENQTEAIGYAISFYRKMPAELKEKHNLKYCEILALKQSAKNEQ